MRMLYFSFHFLFFFLFLICSPLFDLYKFDEMKQFSIRKWISARRSSTEVCVTDFRTLFVSSGKVKGRRNRIEIHELPRPSPLHALELVTGDQIIGVLVLACESLSRTDSSVGSSDGQAGAWQRRPGPPSDWPRTARNSSVRPLHEMPAPGFNIYLVHPSGVDGWL